MMSPHALQPLVDRLLLRSTLDDQEQQALLDLPARAMELPGNYDLIKSGENTDVSYLVASGVLGRFSQMADGVRQIVALHIAGDMADLCSVALPRTSWTFHSLTPSSVVRITHADLAAVADRFPNIAMAFWRDCVADMAVMSEWMVSIARRPAEAKLAHLLCEMRHRHEQAGLIAADGSFTFPVTQLQIAEVLGLTPIHVNRMARLLRERGLAVLSRASVKIDDLEGLIRVAEFDPAYLHLDERLRRPVVRFGSKQAAL